MGAKQSSQTKRGIRLVKDGMSYYAAAKKVGVSPSTLYRAMPLLKPLDIITKEALRIVHEKMRFIGTINRSL